MQKKLLLMLLISAMTISTFGCGKSEEVTNVENLIAELDSNDMQNIINIESAYNALTEKDQEKVEGYDSVLIAKEELISKRNVYAGEWEQLSFDSYLDRNNGMKINLDADDESWTLQDNNIFSGSKKFEICEEYGVTALKDEMDSFYVKTNDADKIYIDAFLSVEITKDNWQDYIEIVKVENPVDMWGEPIDSCYIITSKMYEQGYVVCDEINAAAEYGISFAALSCGGGFGFNDTIETDKQFKLLNAKGSIIYVKKDYVTNYELTNEHRKLEVFGLHESNSSSSAGYNSNFPW